MISNRTGRVLNEKHVGFLRYFLKIRRRERTARIRERFARRMANGTMCNEVLHMRAKIRDQLRVSGKWLATDAQTMLSTKAYRGNPYGSARWAWKMAYRDARIKHKRDLKALVNSITVQLSSGTRQRVTQAVRAMVGENAAIDFRFNSIVIYTDDRHMGSIADAMRAVLPMGVAIDVRSLS